MSAPMSSKRLFAALAAIAAVAVVLVVVLPWYAKKRIVEDAKARGITLSAGEVTVGLGRARVTNVVATVDAAPGAKLSCPDVAIELDFFTPKTITLKSPVIETEGSLAAVRDAIHGDAASAPRVEIQDGLVTFHRAVSEATIEARAVNGHVSATDSHLAAETTITLRTLKFGTYHATFDRSPQKTTVRLNAPTGPAFAELSLGEGSRDLSVHVPKTKATDLGIPSAALGLVMNDDTAAELHVDHHEKDGAVDGHTTFASDAVYVGHSPSPTALSLDVRYAGKGDSWPVSGGTLQAGPFRGDVSGRVERNTKSGTVELHLDSTTQALSCSEAIKHATAQAVGDLAAGTASAFAQLFGMDKAVEGDVKVIAHVDADLANLAQAKIAVRTEGACTLSFIPAPPAPGP